MSTIATESDLQLLARYARDRTEDAFAAIVRRHVDLVHSAALRQVRSPQLAEEVAQSVFTDLARNAHRLTSGGDASSLGSLTPWLYQVTRRTAIDVVRREARRRLREQIATEMNTMNATTAEWAHIEPLLDEAMSALEETDRAAVLLRYFENKPLREVGQTLGTTDDAAQKRVSRAVERLREFFAKRGITTGASGLAVVISANAVQAAPVGLALTISTAAGLAGTTISTTVTATATKAIAMTTLQKTLVIVTIVAAGVATPLVIEHQSKVRLLEENQLLRQQVVQMSELQPGKVRPPKQVASVGNTQLLANNELLKLRGEVALLRRETNEMGRLLEENQRSLSISKPRGLSPKTNQSELSKELWATAEETLLSIARKWPEKNKSEFVTQLAEFLRSESGGSNFFQISGFGEYENHVTLYVHIDQLKELRAFSLERNEDAWQISTSSPVLDYPSAHEPRTSP